MEDIEAYDCVSGTNMGSVMLLELKDFESDELDVVKALGIYDRIL